MFTPFLGKRACVALPYAAALALLVSVAPLINAAETPSFAAMLRQADSRAPLLLEQAAYTRAAAADAQQARAWSNPTLNVTAENLGAPTSGGSSQRQDTYTITQTFETGGKRAARIDAEARKADSVGVREKQARLMFANELAIVYATAEAFQMRLELASSDVVRAQDDLRAAQALVKAGREAELRAAQARASLAAARATQQTVDAEAGAALERLSAMVGVTEPFTQIDHPFLSVAVHGLGQPGAMARQSLTVASAQAEREASLAQVRMEERRWLPDVGVSVGRRKFTGSGDGATVIGLTLNVPLFDRNQSGITAAKERAAGAAMRVEAARLGALAQHRAATAQAAAAQRSLDAAVEAEGAASEAYRLARIGYDAGKASLAELLAIRRAVSEAKTSTIEAQLARVRALAALSVAEGRNVFGETP